MGLPITFAAGYLMDRYGRKVTIVPGFFLTALGLSFMGLTSYMQMSLASFIVAFLWISGSQSITRGNMQVLGTDISPGFARGRFFGIWRLIGQFGSILSPALFALLAEQIAYTASFSFLAICGFIAAAIVAIQIRETVGWERVESRN